MKRVLIIDDSPLICRLLEKALLSFPEFVPVGKASNGMEALELIERLEPDVCTLDVNMPAMDGLVLLKKLMVRRPMPVLMVSALTKEGSRTAFESLRYGALDFLPKPGGLWESGGAFEKVLYDRLKRVAAVDLENIRFITRKRLRKRGLTSAAPARELVVVLTREGSYTFFLRLIQHLEEIRAPQLWCMALPDRWVEAFAEYLVEECELPVKLLQSGETLREGFIYLTGVERWWRLEEDEEGGIRVRSMTVPSGVSREDLFDSLLLEASVLLRDRVLALVGPGRFQKGKIGLSEVRKSGGEVLIARRRECLYPEAPIYFAEGGGFPEYSLRDLGVWLTRWPDRGEGYGRRVEGYAGRA